MKIETVEKTEKQHYVRTTDDEGNVTEVRCKSKAHAVRLAKQLCEELVDTDAEKREEQPKKTGGTQS